MKLLLMKAYIVEAILLSTRGFGLSSWFVVRQKVGWLTYSGKDIQETVSKFVYCL